MTVPKFDELFTDVLRLLSDGSVQYRLDLRQKVIDGRNLSVDDLTERYPSGGICINSRVGWACEYLAQAKAVSRPKRGFLEITDIGRDLLRTNPDGVTLAHVRATDGFQEWHRKSKEQAKDRKAISQSIANIDLRDGDETPSEQIDAAVIELRTALGAELLDQLRANEWQFMERAVLKVLLAMGYGESESDLFHTGGPRDGGIDGIIHEDRLGLDKIYVQSKRYQAETDIRRDAIATFIGDMYNNGAAKGVFITTSDFTDDARETAKMNKNIKVALINGLELVEIMMQYGVGVTTVRTIPVLQLDENFFEG